MSIHPTSPALLALAVVLHSHPANPKVYGRCRVRLTRAIAKLEARESFGPFVAGNGAMEREAANCIRLVCVSCARCSGV